MLSDVEFARFLAEGAVTLDGPWSAAQVSAACTVVDQRLPDDGRSDRRGETCSFFDDPLASLLADPFVEAVAQQVLAAVHVRLFQTAITIAYPRPELMWGFEQHVDIAYSRRDWEAVPRNIICSFFIWLSDVNERRAPMMFCPGSHRLLATRQNGGPPHVEGASLDRLPPLAYGGAVPLTARAGQITVCTTAAVHGSSRNVDATPRRALVATYTAAGVKIGLPPTQAAERKAYLRRLRPLLPPERRHIADDR